MSIFIFGYGSLIKDIQTNKKVYPVKVHGLKRAFNVRTKDAAHKILGVKKNARQWCNGVIFKVNAKELSQIIRREKHYTPELLEPSQISFAYQPSLLVLKPADQIIYFLPQGIHRLSRKQAAALPIKPGYLNKCLTGAAGINEAFLQDFLTTTEDIAY